MKNLLLLICLASVLCTTRSMGAGESGNEAAPGYFANLVESADTIAITNHSNRQDIKATFIDKEWTLRLAAVLRSATYDPQPHCLCISYPIIELKKDGKVILTLSIHHGTKLRAYGKDISGDFEVGATIGGKISALAGEKRLSPDGTPKPPVAELPGVKVQPPTFNPPQS